MRKIVEFSVLFLDREQGRDCIPGIIRKRKRLSQLFSFQLPFSFLEASYLMLPGSFKLSFEMISFPVCQAC